MKKITLILVALLAIVCYPSAQTAGDYRSIGSGNWNDVTKWEMYDGSNWVMPTGYPGQSPGAGAVHIMPGHEIKITATVPHPVASLFLDFADSYTYGLLTFSAETTVSLTISGDVDIAGVLGIENRNGAKTHSLFIGGNLNVGRYIDDVQSDFVGWFGTANGDDKLHVTFNSDHGVGISGPSGISFQDVTFNCAAMGIQSYCNIYGAAAFINGIVYPGDRITFFNGSSVSNASSVSFIDGSVVKYGNGSFTFPIGSNGIYAPITIATTDSGGFFARYTRNSSETLGPIKDTGLYSISSCEYWTLSPMSNPAASADISVGWTAASGCGSSPYIANAGDVTLAVNTSDRWSNHGGSGTGTSTNGSVTWYGVSRFRYFTLGNLKPGCVTPYDLNVTNITATSAKLNWFGITLATSYDVDYKIQGSDVWINAATATPLKSVNLTRLTTAFYRWRVKAHCSSLSTDYIEGSFSTLESDCTAPSNVAANNITHNSVTINWTSVAKAVSYNVEIFPTSGGTSLSAKNVTALSYNFTGLTGSTNYWAQVLCNCSIGTNIYPSSCYFRTEPTPADNCGTPTGLSSTNITNSSATLSWAAAANAVSYTVQYSSQGLSGPWYYLAMFTTELSYNLTGLFPSAQYSWRVISNCNEGPSTWAVATFTAAPLQPPPICNDVYESNNNSNQAKAINLGNTVSAGISSANDVDWFKVTMPNSSNATLQVTLSNLPDDYDVYVYNKNLVLVGSSTNPGNSNEVVIYSTRTRNASYYIKVVGKNGANSNSQCYNLLVQAIYNGGSVARATNPASEITDNSNSPLLYPNPTSEFIQLSFNSTLEGKSDVQIVNAVGQLVKQYPVNIAKGYNQFKIPVKDIRPGMYILKINKDELTLIKRFVIAR